MQIFEMLPGADDFSADSNGQPEGFRNVGLWSAGGWGRTIHQRPAVGDLVVITRSHGKVLYRLNSIAYKFRGSDGNEWWEGVMEDVIAHNLLTQDMIDALKRHNLA